MEATTIKPAKIRRAWVPGLEKRIAAGDNGTLYRYKKTTKALEPIPRTDATRYLQLTDPGTHKVMTYCYEYLIALAFVPKPSFPFAPDKRPQVGFLDGDNTNTNPANLFWKASTTAYRSLQRSKAHQLRTHIQQTHAQKYGNFKCVDQAPNYFVKDDGTLWKLDTHGNLNKAEGHTHKSSGAIHITLGANFPQPFPLAELVADLYLVTPRPGPHYRAAHIDGNRGNTHPANLRWEPNHLVRTKPHRFTSSETTTRHADARDAFRRTALTNQGALYDQGARHLDNNLDLWAHPSGKVYRLSLTTGAMDEIAPDSQGKIWFHGGVNLPVGASRNKRAKISTPRGTNILNFLADAFPDLLDRVRLPGQNCYPLDGNWKNTALSNIGYSSKLSHGQEQRVWKFPLGAEAKRDIAATTHPTAAHSETPADRATDQDNDPDAFEFDL